MVKPKERQKTIKVMVSPALFKELQKYAEPLIDSFEDAVWKVIRAAKEISP